VLSCLRQPSGIASRAAPHKRIAHLLPGGTYIFPRRRANRYASITAASGNSSRARGKPRLAEPPAGRALHACGAHLSRRCHCHPTSPSAGVSRVGRTGSSGITAVRYRSSLEPGRAWRNSGDGEHCQRLAACERIFNSLSPASNNATATPRHNMLRCSSVLNSWRVASYRHTSGHPSARRGRLSGCLATGGICPYAVWSVMLLPAVAVPLSCRMRATATPAW